ncbi:MAG: hypothetical protein H0W64_06930 [Gammaproteobacteria bacterium]|nr:hypothetical protein [Gammaproteobacteria bacterium]
MNCNYEELDPAGITIGIAAFFLALFYAYYLLQKFKLNFKSIGLILLLSALGHFVGAYALFEFAVRNGADSCFYFANATMKNQGVGYWFAFMVLGYAREYLLGDSFLGAFLISGAIGLVASTYLVVIYKILLDKISGFKPFYKIDPQQLIYPAFLLMCWPSYLFWSAGIIKDNFAFLAITMTLFVIVRGSLGFSNLITLAVASVLGFVVRPYLFIIFGVSGFLYLLAGSKIKIQYKLGILGTLCMLFSMLTPLLSSYAEMVHFNGITTIKNIGEYAVRQQGYMAIGSSIPVPTSNPYLMFLFIPYLVFANLLLPLGIGARNFIGIVSSIENVYLLWWILYFIKHRAYWRDLSSRIRITKFLMIYFLFGMMCLSIMCTNLGLAMREKIMYAPALLICMFLCYAYRRMVLLEHHFTTQEIEQSPQPLEPLSGALTSKQ